MKQLPLLALLLCLPVLARTSGGSGTTISGSGTANTLLKFTDTRVAGDSIISDNGSLATITGNVQAVRGIFTQATGTAPLTISSTTLVSNLNADLLDGQEGSYYLPVTNVSGTNNTIAKFTGASTIGDSAVTDDGTDVTIGLPTKVVEASTGGGASSLATTLIVESDDNFMGIDLLGSTSAAQTISFSDSAASDQGRITYLHGGGDKLEFYTGGSLDLDITSTTITAYRNIDLTNVNDGAAANVSLFGSAASGETPELKVSGFRAGDALRTLEIGVGVDADDTASFDGLSTYFFDGTVSVQDGAEATPSIVNDGDANTGMWYPAADTWAVSTGGSERMRIDASGLVGLGVTPSTYRLYVYQDVSDYITRIQNIDTTSPFGVWINYSGTTPNGTGNEFFICTDASATRCVIRSNGGIANYQANDVNLSDSRLKDDLGPAPVTWLWNKYKDLIWHKYKYKDGGGRPTLGLMAQEVEQVIPQLVDNSGFGEAPEGEAPLKAIYQHELEMGGLIILQEAQRRIESLETRIAALEAAK